MTAPTPPASEESPVYRKVQQRRDDGSASSLYLITCDEGWRSLVLASGIYEHDADFLLSLLGRKSRMASVRERAGQSGVEPSASDDDERDWEGAVTDILTVFDDEAHMTENLFCGAPTLEQRALIKIREIGREVMEGRR